MNYDDERTNRVSRLIIIGVAISLLIIAGLIYYISTLKTDIEIEKSVEENKSIKTRIDSLETERTDLIDSVLTKSQSSADRANQITKTIEHEKIIISDTSYAAMCEYLSNYRS